MHLNSFIAYSEFRAADNSFAIGTMPSGTAPSGHSSGQLKRPSPAQATEDSEAKHQRASLVRNYAEPRQPRVGSKYQVDTLPAPAKKDTS